MERTEIDGDSRMAAVYFPGVDVEYWFTNQHFVAGEQLHHNGVTWVIATVQEGTRGHGQVMVTCRRAEEAA
jgi:hypothetical protein